MHLRHISSENGSFLLIDFENYLKWFELLGLSVESETDIARLNEVYLFVAKILVPESTGILMSPHFGWEVINRKPAGVGVVFSIEQKVADHDPLALPLLSKLWSIEHIRNNYGVAKLQLLYHPLEALATKKRKLAAELYEYAQYEQIDFIIELNLVISDQADPNSDEQNNNLLTAIKHLRQDCDLLVLDGSINALMAATITAELDVPWIAKLERFESYQEFKENVRMLVENGAAGFIFGPEILVDLLTNFAEMNQEDLLSILTQQARDRIIELRRIVEERQIV